MKRTKPCELRELQLHVLEISQRFQVAIEWIPPRAVAQAVSLHILDPNKNEDIHAVFISPILDETTYAVAMHEFGHCLHPLGTTRTKDEKEYDRMQLLRERSAWEWAMHYALDWTPSMEHVRILAFKSYEDKAKDAARAELLRQRAEVEMRKRDEKTRAALKSFIKRIR